MTATLLRAPARPVADAVRPLLTAGIVVALLSLVVALVGLVVDPREIGGAPAWLKPMKFGVSATLYLVTIRWMLGVVPGHRRLLMGVAAVMVAGLTLELVAIDLQVLRNTTSHFNTSSAFDLIVYSGMGALISTVFVVTAVAAVLVLRTPGVQRSIAAGMRWGLLLSLAGMAEAVLMTVNFGAARGGGHTVGGPDGGPGIPVTDWSLLHGDLRVGHFLGLHALQVLPIIAFLLLRIPGLDDRTRTRLIAVVGTASAALMALVTWQALRGQALLSPDALTFAAGAAIVAGVAVATAAVLARRIRA